MARMSMAELADHFGVAQSTVWKWSRRPGFPGSLGFRPNRVGLQGRFPEVWDSRAVAKWRRHNVRSYTWRPPPDD